MKHRFLTAVLMSLPLTAVGQGTHPCGPSKAAPAPVLPVVVIEGHRPPDQPRADAHVPLKLAQPTEGPADADAHAVPLPEHASLEHMLFQTRDELAQLRRDVSQLREEVREMHRYRLMHPELPTQGLSATEPTTRSD